MLKEPKVNLGVDANCRWDEELSRGVCCCRKGGGLEARRGSSEGRNRREAGVYFSCEYIDSDRETDVLLVAAPWPQCALGRTLSLPAEDRRRF